MSLSAADQHILERRVRPLVDAALINEHREHPLGPHSPRLTEVLHFLRRSPDPELRRYVVLRIGRPLQWAIGVRPVAHTGEPHLLDELRYATRAAAEHAVFLQRIYDYGLAEPPPAQPSSITQPSSEVMRRQTDLMGYVDALSVAPAESVSLFVHSSRPRWSAQLVRLLCADLAPEGPALREEVVHGVDPIEREGISQRTAVGSYARVEIPDGTVNLEHGLSCRVWVMPSLPAEGAQALVSHRDAAGTSGWSLRLNERGAVCLWVGSPDGAATVELDEPLIRGCWYFVVAVVDPRTARLQVGSKPAGARAANRVWIGRGEQQRKAVALPVVPRTTFRTPLLMASGWLDADGQPHERFDGRLELPTVIGAALDLDQLLAHEELSAEEVVAHFAPLAAWDFSAGLGRTGIARTHHIEDLAVNGWHARCINHPMRAVTSHNWDGQETDFRHAPNQYAAAHFHRDDITDCAWIPQATIHVPQTLRSGVYAMRLQGDAQVGAPTDRVPFVIRPPRDRATAPLLLILPTNSYLAYANDHVAVDSPRVQMMVRRALHFDEFDLMRHHHRELGASLYETHPDGTGICYSSWRRPLLTMRPQAENFSGRAWQFTADLQLVDWLDRNAREVDVVTDLDVHRDGRELLRRYRCVMTGTHPEYSSLAMLDAIGDYVDEGGRFVYLGGNGFYWVTAFDPEDEQVIEIRRWGGSEAWRARPGEYHLSFSGEPGGLWRNRGRAPQKTVGVGFVAAGLVDAGAVYVRSVDHNNAAAWVLAGVQNTEFGLRGTSGPAAGLEVDAVDPELGTAAATIVVASSGGCHNDDMLEARENYGMTLAAPGGARNPRVRADMVLMPGPRGGGVFSTGSIAWAGALAHDSDVSRIMANVLERFLSAKPLLD
jgi:N,N-dimethylformamidase